MDPIFTVDDLDILNEALNIVPELKVCAMAVRERRRLAVTFPIIDCDGVFKLLEARELVIANHRINRALIKRYFHPALFPISDDRSLMRAVYLAVGACNHDWNWALQAQPYAEELLREVKTALDQEVR